MIAAENATFGYAGCATVQAIDFQIAAAETVSIVGSSGSGKTTILKTIGGEIPLVSGALKLAGEVRDAQWIKLSVARTLQSFPLLHWLTVRENLELAASIRGISKADIDSVLQLFSAYHLRDKYPRTLSGGERCRASLSQAALTKPKILLLDEPFTGLDIAVKEDIAETLFAFSSTHQTAIIFVTHDVLDAVTYSSRVLVLSRSRPCNISRVIDSRGEGALLEVQRAIQGSH